MEQPIPATKARFTPAEYFAYEVQSVEKHEYVNGELISMAGGTESHSLIILNIGGELRYHLKGRPCRAYESNLRVRVERDARYSYPDIFVVCGDREFDEDDPNKTTILNPTLVVEVLSPSTERDDRGQKFQYYIRSTTLKEYVLIAQDKPYVETLLRQPDGTWSLAYFNDMTATVKFRSIEVEIPLAEIYANVVFPPVTLEGHGLLVDPPLVK